MLNVRKMNPIIQSLLSQLPHKPYTVLETVRNGCLDINDLDLLVIHLDIHIFIVTTYECTSYVF